MLTPGEGFMVVAGGLLAVSLPLLARGSYGLWLAAQGLYFLGLVVVMVDYLAKRRA